MEPFLDREFGNPSGIHAVSRRAKDALEDARERVAGLLGAEHPLDIVFTGGGTESDNLGVAGPVLAGGQRRGVVTTAIEHEAVLETVRFLERLGCPVAIVGVDAFGRASASRIVGAVTDTTRLVSIMAANNETGVVQPVGEVAASVRDRSPGVIIHSDGVQAFVSRDISLRSLGVDLLTVAAHKVGGPKGVGVLATRPGVVLEPVIHGGGQELGRRSGTHNLAGIVGMAAALEAAVKDRPRFDHDVGEARRRFETRLLAEVPGAALTAPGADRLVQHSHFRIAGVDADTLLIRLDTAGVAAAAGSACHSGAIEVSHVLAAMGMNQDQARSSVRFTFGWTTRPEDGDAAADAVAEAVGGLR